MSEHYRFRSIGGTSAGAIAAVVTAAAEYNRDGGGYGVIGKIPAEMQSKLATLFQPSPPLRKVFEAALLILDGKTSRAIFKLLGYGPYFIAGLLVAIALVVAAVKFCSLSAFLLALICLAAGLVLLLISLVRNTLRDLVANDFGFCPGPTQPGHDDPALSNWLADRIEMAAGRMVENGPRPATPLTFNDIWVGKNAQGSAEDRAVNLRMMTTNLSLRRPNALPSMDANHYFKEEEFARLFPDWRRSRTLSSARSCTRRVRTIRPAIIAFRRTATCRSWSPRG
jgi:hypothetical protein